MEQEEDDDEWSRAVAGLMSHCLWPMEGELGLRLGRN